MKRLFIGLVILLTISTGNAHDLADKMNEVLPSIAYIRVAQFVDRETFDPVTKLTSSARVPTTPVIGTGFVIDNNNVVTNYHVIAFAVKHNTDIHITFIGSNQRFVATVIGYDKIADVALLAIPGEHEGVEILEDISNVRMGDPVFSISHFYGIGWSATQGSVSSTHRRDQRYPYIRNLQLQLLQGSGSSGGPVFDENGKVIALNRSIVSMFPRSIMQTGRTSMLSMVGYPVSGDTLLIAVKAIRKDIIVVHLDLGVSLIEFGENSMFHLNYTDGDDEYPIGTMVMSVDENSNTTLKDADIIISIEGNEFSDPAELFTWLNNQTRHKPGDTVNVQVYRDSEIINIAVPITIVGL